MTSRGIGREGETVTKIGSETQIGKQRERERERERQRERNSEGKRLRERLRDRERECKKGRPSHH